MVQLSYSGVNTEMAGGTKYTQIDEYEHRLSKNPKITREIENAIVNKTYLIWEEYARFWKPALEKGDRCWAGLIGEYFTSTEELAYESQDKILFKSPDLVPKLAALEGMQINSRKSGITIPLGAEDAPGVEKIEIVMDAIKNQNKLRRKLTATFRNGIVSSFPQAMFFDRQLTDDLTQKDIVIENESWNGVLPSPNFRREDCKDSDRFFRVFIKNKPDLLQRYAKRYDVLNERLNERDPVQDLYPEFGETYTSDDRDKIIKNLQDAQIHFNRTGEIAVVESFHKVYRTYDCWMNIVDGKLTVLPPYWADFEVQRWIEANQETHQRVKRRVPLWMVTAITTTGTLLENDLFWLQDGEPPFEFYIPKMWNNQPRGIFEFLLGTTKAANVAEIEHLHSLRLVNDELVIIQDGALKDPSKVAREKGRVGGVIVTRANIPASEAINFVQNKREQMGWADFGLRMQDKTDRLSTNQNFEGGMQTSQESGKAIDRRNVATANKFAPDMDSFNDFNMRVHRRILKMIPATHTEATLYRYVDQKTKQPTSIVLNQPVFDINGVINEVKNDLSGAKYDYIESEDDDSVTAKERDLMNFIEIMQGVGNTVTEPKFLAEMLVNIPNTIAQKYGMALLQKMKEEAEAPPQPEPMKGNLSLKGEDLLHPNPFLLEILVKNGYISQESLQSQGAQQPSADGAQPPPEIV